MKKQLPGWAVLLIITLIAGIALGATYALTKDPIAEQARIQAENARKAALPEADSFEELAVEEGSGIDWAYAGLKDGAPIGYVAQKTVNGFGGEVEVIAGVNTQDQNALTLGGISVGGSNFSETAGLGARSRDLAFTDQFIGKAVPVKYIKAGEEAGDNTVDALTSATITTTAVVNGVNDIVKYVKGDVLGIAGVEMPARPGDEYVYASSAQGFRGPVYVEAAFGQGGEITYISVGDDSFAEDIGIGAKEPEFMIQFIGKAAPLTLADVDALAGATITTNAVITALNQDYELSQGGEIAVPEIPALPEKPADAEVYSSVADGYRGPVAVEAAFGENGEITYMSVGDDTFLEDLGAGAREPAFISQFIGKTAPLTLSDVDALTGATITTNAVVTALNDAWDQSQGKTAPTEAPTQAPTVSPTAAPTVAPAPAPAPIAGSRAASAFSGTETGEALMFFTVVKADVTVENGVITDVKLNQSAAGSEAEEPLMQEEAFKSLLIGSAVPVNAEDLLVSGVPSYLSSAVALAVNQAADGAASTAPAAPAAGSGTYTGEALVFFTDIQANASFDGDILSDFELLSRSAGSSSWEPLDQEQLYLEALTGAAMPLSSADFSISNDYLDQAVAMALNDAYAQYGAGADGAETLYAGDCVIFFTEIHAEAAFQGDEIASVKLSQRALGDAEYASLPQDDAFQTALTGEKAPLDAAQISVPGAEDYVVRAVVVAVNEAYAQSQAAKP